MKQFLSSDAKDKVLTEWQSLKLPPFESIHKYVDKFWDLHLKATVYKKIDFEEQNQQFYAGLPEDKNEYVNSQRPKSISVVIHHTMVAARINFQQGAKKNLKPMETKEKHEHKGKNQPQNYSKGNSSNNKAKEKGVYKGKNKLTPKELECYRKHNQCFKCGEQGHAYQACPQRNARNEQPRASIIESSKQPGLLQPLPILDSPWESIAMDFIFGLPKSIHGNMGIWTIVDRFSTQAHFIPVKKTIKAHQMETLFISQIFKYHGLPTSIVSDRDPNMTNNFWKVLFENLGSRLDFSLAYHPQTDVQNEIANLTILDLLKSYVTEVNQRSQWEKYLPLVEYAYNNTVHTSTGKTPFEVIEGRLKSPLLLKVHGKIFAADEYSRDLKESFQKIKEAISISQEKQKAVANKHRRALAFKENDWVLHKFPKACLKHTSGKNPTGHQKYYAKLAKRYYGPFQILKPISEMAYQLKLPNHWLIHNAFHVSLLKPYKGEPSSEAITEDPPKVEDQEEVLQPFSILRHEDKVLRHDKVVAFIQQFDAAFGDEGFTEFSKLRHVALHFQKSTRQWWASLRTNGEAPQTWKNLRASIMKQFLSSDAKDKVLTEWQSLKLPPFESIHKYVDKFWDLHLKATVYKKIDFEEQNQQFYAGLPEDKNEYVNSQRPKSISVVIHHTMVAARINFQQGAKKNLKPMETKEKHEHKGKNQPQNYSKGNSSNNKAKEKGVYKGKNKLTPKELECYRKHNQCFKCGEQGHAYQACPQRNARNEQPRASIIESSKQPGLLQPLPILDSPWESIAMDFIFGLPKSIHGNMGIWTIVDRFSTQAHFIPVKKTIKAHQMETLFISQIFKYHGLPTSIVSDRDPNMTNNFWKVLFENLGSRLDFSLAYHPQKDVRNEIANLTILDLLKSYVTEVNQRSQWEKYLPLVEYAYNNTVHTSTGKTPFEVIEGRLKSPLLLKVHGKIFAADEYSRDLKESFQKIKEAISISQEKQKAVANKHRRALAFKENDWVLHKFPKACLRHTSGKNPTGHQKYYAKLAKRYYGPFQILKPISEMAYQLKLPNHWLIHNAFHVSLLKPYKGEPSSEAITEDPPKVEDQEEVLQPFSILRHEDKVLRHGKTIRRYLIKFKNYPFEDARWMQGIQLKDSMHLVNAYNDSLE
ncbi:hypothetical protein L7F22_011228 [Adiantum nelumboides]|nr:hypothetical protein [Adiantum nelumboides]